VLLFGQPLTRIAKLRRDDPIDHGDRVAVRLGRGPVELPEPLARIAIDLRANHAGRGRASPLPTATRLLPGRKPGT
jgi:hypothetical protein